MAPTLLDLLLDRWTRMSDRSHFRIAVTILLLALLFTAWLDDPALYQPGAW